MRAKTAGVTDSEIKIGQTMPYSGPPSAYGLIGKAQAAVFEKINAEGGRKIRFVSLDQVAEVELDEVQLGGRDLTSR